MKALIDTDALLDVALCRAPFFDDSAAVLAWAEGNPAAAAVAWLSVSNLFYLVRPDSRGFIRDLLEFVEIAMVTTDDMRAALGFPMKDLEDSTLASAALAFGAGYIVTRNFPDYRHLPVPPLEPWEFLKLVAPKRG